MLTWTERGSAQKNADGPVKSPSAQPVDKTGPCVDFDCALAMAVLDGLISDPAIDAKVYSTLAARFAIVGRELRIKEAGDRTYFEVRCWDGGSYICSTLHDLSGLLARIGVSA